MEVVTMTDGTQFNAKRLLEDVHELVRMLRGRQFAGQSPTVVPSPKDNGEHRAAQRQLKSIVQMLQPAAADREEWTEPVGEVLIPEEDGESGQRQAANARGANIEDGAVVSPEMRRQLQKDKEALENGEPLEDTTMLGGSPSTTASWAASASSDRGSDSQEYTRVELSLADVASWQGSVEAEKEDKRRGMSGSTTTVEAYLPMAFMQDAVEQIWRILNELDLGIPSNSRPFTDYE